MIRRRRRYDIGVTNSSTDATQALGDILIFQTPSSSSLYDDNDDDDNSSSAMCYFSRLIYGHSGHAVKCYYCNTYF